MLITDLPWVRLQLTTMMRKCICLLAFMVLAVSLVSEVEANRKRHKKAKDEPVAKKHKSRAPDWPGMNFFPRRYVRLLSDCVSFRPSVHPSASPYVFIPVRSSIHLSVRLFVHWSNHSSFYQPALRLCVHLFICPSIYPSIHPSVYPIIRLSIYHIYISFIYNIY